MQWGPFLPTKLEATDGTTKARESMLSMIFLAGADKERCGTLKMELNNSYLAKKDNYPKSLDTTLQLLSHYQDHTVGDQLGRDNLDEGAAFAQKRKRKLSKVRCYKCNELGHYKTVCPLNQQHYQQAESDSNDSDYGVIG